MTTNVIPIKPPASVDDAERLHAAYQAARADLERRWPNVGIEDLRRVVAAFDAFQRAMR